jgi:hypothetical protein
MVNTEGGARPEWARREWPAYLHLAWAKRIQVLSLSLSLSYINGLTKWFTLSEIESSFLLADSRFLPSGEDGTTF